MGSDGAETVGKFDVKNHTAYYKNFLYILET